MTADYLTQSGCPWRDIPPEVKQIALTMRKQFLEEEQLTPVLIAEKPKHGRFVTAIHQFIPEHVDMLEALMIRMARDGATLLCIGTEAWAAFSRANDQEHNRKLIRAATHRQLKHAEGRIEILSLTAETPEHFYMMRAKIQRDRVIRLLDWETHRLDRRQLRACEQMSGLSPRLQNIFAKAGR
jgi:hypothetical protein